MPTVEKNLHLWNQQYNWKDAGDEWSQWWGGPERQWKFSILPRIKRFLPVGSILEIAPGYGRWTTHLKDLCDSLTVVDLSPNCIEYCQNRFKETPHIQYYVNEGKNLEMIDDNSIDFIFSFDSLVHVEEDVIEAYLNQLGRKLTRNGVGFIHHSNAGEYRRMFKMISNLPEKGANILAKLGLLDSLSMRALSMSVIRFGALANKAGLTCINQEKVNWGGRRLIDCISTFTREGSKWDQPNQIKRNPYFMSEAKRIAKM